METGRVSNRFNDYLAEQMKDPQFAAAYKEVSAEEDAKLAEILRLERKVIEAVKVAWIDGLISSTTLNDAVKALVEFEAKQETK